MSNNDAQHIEMNVELSQYLREGEDNYLLIVNKGKHNLSFDKVADTSQPHTISWTLTGNASSGEFCALDEADNPGFVWLVRKPSEKIFRDLQLVAKNRLTIRNHHHDKTSKGLWRYQLFARFGDKVFGIPLTFACGLAATDANPSIKNT